MKFFEFDDYAYYGLVLADNEEKAKLGYTEIIADILEEDEDLSPRIITLEQALSIYIKSDIEDCETDKERKKDFYQNIKNFKDYIKDGSEQYQVLLMDGSLL